MTKSELGTGMVVTLRNGMRMKVMLHVRICKDHTEDFIVEEKGTARCLRDYSEDLLTIDGNEELDIMKVEDFWYFRDAFSFDSSTLKLEWTRHEPVKEMTLSEIEEALGHKVKIINDN